MTAQQQREPHWLRPAPTVLPFTQVRVHGQLQTQFDQEAYTRSLTAIPSRELLDHLEHLRFLAVEFSDHPKGGDSRKVAEIRISELVAECARRQRLIATGDDLAPRWPERRDLGDRIRAVKVAWPIDRMVTELMGVRLERSGNKDRRKGLCPIHQERTPSFYIDVTKGTFKCFGCGEGGDVIDLAGIQFGFDRTIDKIECLERWAGIKGTSA